MIGRNLRQMQKIYDRIGQVRITLRLTELSGPTTTTVADVIAAVRDCLSDHTCSAVQARIRVARIRVDRELTVCSVVVGWTKTCVTVVCGRIADTIIQAWIGLTGVANCGWRTSWSWSSWNDLAARSFNMMGKDLQTCSFSLGPQI